MNRSEVESYLEEGIRARSSIDPSLVLSTGEKIAERINAGNKIIVFGNGGSAADAQHIAAEFVGRFEKERRPVPALALHANTSSLTAIANDYGYEHVFERQVEAFARKGDVVIGISTSGNSVSVLMGIAEARKLGCLTIGMTGSKGGKLSQAAEIAIKIQSDRTSIIQECHIAIGHIISKVVEDRIDSI
ncbi:MAG: D-sedoheptulose 7-phosphate isomerase [Candidatus Thermoplasmatota archaeon]|nr:D-sedoheptulose 7-phosphate isomerase [Candidatus Thermoplasmatota archaeon]MCL5793798.1 D-sedoheptulose 7-phosphate isomerase [Candidatus Thermoplasmatota archaeon]